MEYNMATRDKPVIDFGSPPTAYGYNDAGLFTQAELCSPNPLESELTGNAVWLLPANSTFVAPPSESGKVAVWNGVAWELKEDNRGTKYWLPGDDWQTEPREMKDLGPLPAGAVLTRPEPTQDKKFVLLRSERDHRIGATDYLMMPDYPIPEDQRTVVQVYRQALRDLPAQPGAPWDGGGKETPWPALPKIMEVKK